LQQQFVDKNYITDWKLLRTYLPSTGQCFVSLAPDSKFSLTFAWDFLKAYNKEILEGIHLSKKKAITFFLIFLLLVLEHKFQQILEFGILMQYKL
jgi:hypothetical protein